MSFFKSKHEKSRKKQSKKYDSLSDSDTSDDKLQWVEASPSHSKKLKKKKKKKHKKHQSSSSSSESDKWIESSHSSSKQKEKNMPETRKGESASSSDSDSQSINKCAKFESSDTISERRDNWMNDESFVPTLSKDEMFLSSRQKRLNSMKEHRDREEKIQRERELNPHWKNDGTGLPEKGSDVESLSLPSTSVGDGGYSWLKKAYYRIQEQAQQEGRSMEEIAVERWGSLSKLTSLIEEAEERMKSHPDFKSSRSRQYNDKYEHSRSNRPYFKKPRDSYESEKNFDSPFQFKKPTENSKNHKVNQFKSSRKSTYINSNELNDSPEYKNSDYYDNLSKEKPATSEREKIKIKKSEYGNNESRTPAWKKPKYSVEKSATPEREGNKVQKNAHYDSKKYTPAWKKPEYSVERTKVAEVSVNSEASPSEKDDTPIIYSDDCLNKLAAKQLKAELMGNNALAEKLKIQLEEAKRVVKEKGFAKQPSKKTEEVILTKIDSQGQVRPVQTSQDKIEDFKHKKSNKYFDDGSRYSLKQMFEREKLTTADDHMEMFVEATAHSNEMAEIDYESGHISKKLSKKISASREEERDIGKAIQQHQKRTSSLEKCEYCLDQPRVKKNLIVDTGEQIYLSLPNFQTLTNGHCLIVPKSHVSSFLFLDENEWKEVNDFKNQLRRMFRLENKSIIFLETSMNFRYFPHAVIECIPVPVEEGDMAPFYFKKAIQESEYEWANNKKLIDLTKKGLRYSVPKNLPYFHVEFDPQVHAGYAHVIEEEKYFPRNFGKEVVGGMLDIDYNYLYKNKKENPLKKCQDAVNFQKSWEKFKSVD